MDTEVTEILDHSLNSTTIEEVTIYEVTEYRPRPDVGHLLQQYPHIFLQLCDGEIIDAESGEHIVNMDLAQFIENNGLEEQSLLEVDSRLPSQISPPVLIIDEGYVIPTQPPQEISSTQNMDMSGPVDLTMPRVVNPLTKRTNQRVNYFSSRGQRARYNPTRKPRRVI